MYFLDCFNIVNSGFLLEPPLGPYKKNYLAVNLPPGICEGGMGSENCCRLDSKRVDCAMRAQETTCQSTGTWKQSDFLGNFNASGKKRVN